jgi:hypothetical protein
MNETLFTSLTKAAFMKSFRSKFIAVLLAGLAGMAMAQTPADPTAQTPCKEHTHNMHNKMHDHHLGHLKQLKVKLNLQASQESAWASFAQSMQKPERKAPSVRASMEKMSTLERLDSLQAMAVDHTAQMQKRIDATRAFYASLNTEQKQVFDQASARILYKAHGMHRMKHIGEHSNMH